MLRQPPQTIAAIAMPAQQSNLTSRTNHPYPTHIQTQSHTHTHTHGHAHASPDTGDEADELEGMERAQLIGAHSIPSATTTTSFTHSSSSTPLPLTSSHQTYPLLLRDSICARLLHGFLVHVWLPARRRYTLFALLFIGLCILGVVLIQPYLTVEIPLRPVRPPQTHSDFTFLRAPITPPGWSQPSTSIVPKTTLPLPPPRIFDQYQASVAAPPFTYVTAANSKYFESLENLIGSIHHHSPNFRIIVYDLGLTKWQQLAVQTFFNVILISQDEWMQGAFNFLPKTMHQLPGHITEATTFAFKPIIMLDSLTRLKQEAIFYVDSGLELESYPSIVENLLATQGYFFVVQEGQFTKQGCCGRIGELTHKGMLDYLGLDQNAYYNVTMVAGGIQAYRADSIAIDSVLRPTVACAMALECIAPAGSDVMTHRQDQSAFSIFVAKSGLKSERDLALWGNSVNILNAPLDNLTRQLIYKRRLAPNKPYSDFVLKQPKLALVVPFVTKELDQVHALWELMQKFQPCRLPTQTKFDLILFNHRTPNKTMEDDLLRMIQAVSLDSPVHQCFESIAVQYARLLPEEDQYPSGPNFMFDRLINDPLISLRPFGYTHFFLFESDTAPIRPLWLDAIWQMLIVDSISFTPAGQTLTIPSSTIHTDSSSTTASALPALPSRSLITYARCDWWVQGSIYRGTLTIGSWLLHVNGNAVYHLSSNFIRYATQMWTELDIFTHAYDGALVHWIFGDPIDSKICGTPRGAEGTAVWHKFRFSDTIQNCWHESCGSMKSFLMNNPFTYVVHMSTNHPHNKSTPWGFYIIVTIIGCLGIGLLIYGVVGWGRMATGKRINRSG